MERNRLVSRTRARVICVPCHERKVRCDLQDSHNKICSNCRRLEQLCIPRRGRRYKGRVSVGEPADVFRQSDSMLRNGAGESTPAAGSPTVGDRGLPAYRNPEPRGFIASDSVLFEAPWSGNIRSASSLDDWRQIEQQLQDHSLRIYTAQVGEPLGQALRDSFAENLGHWYPFIDSSEVDLRTSPLLGKTLLLAGSLTRRIETVDDLQIPYALYQQSKDRIYSSSGDDPLTLLKAITTIAYWSLRPPSVVSLDGPWHWAGLAMRLALQLGMHRESTYSRLEDPTRCRLLWWHLMSSDVLQAVCWGRPCLIQLSSQDVQLPQQSEFASIPLQAFEGMTRLLLILRKAVELKALSPSGTVAALIDWHRTLPLQLKLHNLAGSRTTYIRAVNEMFILYFAIILHVLFRYDLDKDRHPRVSPTAIAASSCMIRLYEEIYHHEQAARLGSIHGFFLMLAAIPQIFHRTHVAEKEMLRSKELDLICAILKHLRVKFGGCNMVLNRILRLRAESQSSAGQNSAADVYNAAGGISAEGPIEGADQLFPFPAEFSTNLDLLQRGESVSASHEDVMIDVLAFESSLIDWSVDYSSNFHAMTAADFPLSAMSA